MWEDLASTFAHRKSFTNERLRTELSAFRVTIWNSGCIRQVPTDANILHFYTAAKIK